MKEELHTIIDLLERSCRRFPENVYLWEKQAESYQATTYREVREQVGYVAAGLMAAGLKKDDRVALLSEGCNDWIYAELGVLYAGGGKCSFEYKVDFRRIGFSDKSFGCAFSDLI